LLYVGPRLPPANAAIGRRKRLPHLKTKNRHNYGGFGA